MRRRTCIQISAKPLNEGAPIDIPYVVVPMQQPKVAIQFRKFGEEGAVPDESDSGPYPVPRNAPVEGGLKSQDDRHVIVVQEGSCTLFELYKAVPHPDGSWAAVGSARFDLESNELRPDTWTSADAAGLPIFPGLVHADEIAAGEINHALRFTAGDIVSVTRIDRLARSTFDPFAIVKRISDASAQFRSIAEPWADTGTSTGRLMLAVSSGLTDVERDLIRTRTAERAGHAQLRGKHMGRPRR